MKDELLWKVKTLAFLHDPAEKALVLLRGKSHETGTVASLKRLLFEVHHASEEEKAFIDHCIKKADHWASAADRPSLPMNVGGSVNFAKDPQIIHPLSGQNYSLSQLDTVISPEAIEAASFDHFQQLIVKNPEGKIDWKKTFLTFWRFGPSQLTPDLGTLWNILPADTRSPDHTIWEHLKLTSAFAGTFAADDKEGPALMLMSIGPVQGFIAQARSISDLWAGSHLLSQITWEALEYICDNFGPDSVLFPDLTKVPIADLWLYKSLGADHWKEEDSDWMKIKTDDNPLFSAALPNRFVTILPTAEAKNVAQEITEKVRLWVKTQALKGWLEIVEKARGKEHAEFLKKVFTEKLPKKDFWERLYEDSKPSENGYALNQIARQFRNFPEVHWALIPWRLAGNEMLEDNRLKEILKALGASDQYLDSQLDSLIRNEITIEGYPFYTPNPGVAYPGLYEALERLHGSAKSVRPFHGKSEKGFRCTLCGEREWLTEEEMLLILPPGERKKESLWAILAEKAPALAKEGEHLCGLCALKRTWPRLFVQNLEETIPDLGRVDRFVLSTHAMALASSLWNWLDEQKKPKLKPEDLVKNKKAEGELKINISERNWIKGVALPRSLYERLQKEKEEDIAFIKKLPALLDDTTEETEKNKLSESLEKYLGVKPETYYALIKMDGDKMGAWLAGEEGRMPMKMRFHRRTLEALGGTEKLHAYLEAPRPASPTRHQVISTALNAFSLNLARVVVEDLFMGKLIYAGGDDLLAMVAIQDLPGLMWVLRCAFSGTIPADMTQEHFWSRVKRKGKKDYQLQIKNGFARLNKQLFRLMGEKATASMGVVITHHQSPLTRVLDDLNRAEQMGKGSARDGFCITLDKRAGGTIHFYGQWKLDKGFENSDLGLLLEMRDLIAGKISRRAAYIIADILRDIPPQAETITAVLNYQFKRQSVDKDIELDNLPQRLAVKAIEKKQENPSQEWPAPNLWLRNLILVAEFLAREGRIELEE